MTATRRDTGFTIPELIVVIAVVGVIIAVATFFVHPKSYDASNRDAERWLDVSRLTTALSRYYVDHGSLPPGIPKEATIIGSDEGYVNMCEALVPAYLKDLPLDPQVSVQLSTDTCVSTKDAPTLYHTGYTVQYDHNKLTVAAPAAEGGTKISVSRTF
jgi:prepilin-type N-terminal cleavage/methylation domain-containing protein